MLQCTSTPSPERRQRIGYPQQEKGCLKQTVSQQAAEAHVHCCVVAFVYTSVKVMLWSFPRQAKIDEPGGGFEPGPVTKEACEDATAQLVP